MSDELDLIKGQSRLEHLPDELLLLICRYLNQVEILNSFCNLNSRLNKLISQFAAKIDMNRIPSSVKLRFIDDIWPRIGHHVRRLRVADVDDDVDETVDYRSLFVNLESVTMLNQFSYKYLLNMRSIEIDLVSVELESHNELVDRLLYSGEHSNLESLVLTSFHGLNLSHIQKRKIDLNLRELKITLKNNIDLSWLLDLLPESMERLDIDVVYNGQLRSKASTDVELERVRYFHLRTRFEDSISFEEMENIVLRRFVRLEDLSIETLTRDEHYVNGDRWQRLVRKMKSIERFNCAIRFRFPIDSSNVEEHEQKQFDRQQTIFNSFSTDFWINERRWFIHLYSNRLNNDESPTNILLKNKSYGKIFIHTIPYNYPSIEINRNLGRARSTFDHSFLNEMYHRTKRLHFDGEDLPIDFDLFRQLMREFRLIEELKYDRLVFSRQTPLSSLNSIEFKHLTKLIVERKPTAEVEPLNLTFLRFSKMIHLRYIRCPQISFPDDASLHRSLENIVLTDCETLNFDFLRFYVNLRSVKLDFVNLARLMESRSELMLDVISSIFKINKSISFLQLVCAAIHRSKVKLLEKMFQSDKAEHLFIKSNEKSLTIHRRIGFPSTSIDRSS